PDPSFLPVIFSAPVELDPWLESTWRLANPALGTFRSLDEFRIAAPPAQETPGRQAAFRALYLNQMFVGAESRWLPLDAWDACQRRPERLGGARTQSFEGAAMSVSPSAV